MQAFRDALEAETGFDVDARARGVKSRRTIFSNGSLSDLLGSATLLKKAFSGLSRLESGDWSFQFYRKISAGRGISAILGCVIATLFGGRIQPAAGADAWGVCHVAGIRRPL